MKSIVAMHLCKGEKIMVKVSWLPLICMSLGLMACQQSIPICPYPGGIVQRIPHDDDATNFDCHWLLTITRNVAKDPSKESYGHEVWGHVARSAVQNNIANRPWYDFRRQNIEMYTFNEYPIPLSNPNDKDKLEIGRDYWFIGSPGSPLLKLTLDKDLPDHKNEVPRSALAGPIGHLPETK
jgi:hypothetical protein